MQVLLPALQLVKERLCCWVYVSVGMVHAPCETAAGAGQRESAGKGRGLGLGLDLGLGRHLPGCSMIDEPFCEPNPDSQPV